MVFRHAAFGIQSAANVSVTSRSAPHSPITSVTRRAGRDTPIRHTPGTCACMAIQMDRQRSYVTSDD